MMGFMSRLNSSARIQIYLYWCENPGLAVAQCLLPCKHVPVYMFVYALGISLHMCPLTPTANHDCGASPGVCLMFATGRAQGKVSVTK